MDTLALIGRKKPLFDEDMATYDAELKRIVSESSFLVLGGAGSIGQAVVKELFKRNPKKLHVVDLSENNLAELVRDLRSSIGYIDGEFKTYALDIGTEIYDSFIEKDGLYDYVLNLSALKHVRSEEDPFTLMRMIDVNVFNTDKTILQSINKGTEKYFCVSTDKAANPVNMMGASKRIMEKFLMRRSEKIAISTARFANVAFSDGSLLHSFNQRIQKKQPLVAPSDVKRYFVTPEESGQLCLMSCIYGETRDIFFPKLSESFDLKKFSDIAISFLGNLGYEAEICTSEKQAREHIHEYIREKKWPCFFHTSNTTGEQDFEEFFTGSEQLDLKRFDGLGVIKNDCIYDESVLNSFTSQIELMKSKGAWSKKEIVDLFFQTIPELDYVDTGKYLDSKM